MSILFVGANSDYLETPSGVVAILNAIKNECAFVVRVRRNSIFSAQHWFSANNQPSFFQIGSDAIRFKWGLTGTYTSPAGQLADTNEHTAGFSGSILANNSDIFVDGASVSNGGYSPGDDCTVAPLIGVKGGGDGLPSGSYHDGNISEIGVFGRPLSAPDHLKIHNGAQMDRVPGLVLLWQFNTQVAGTMQDGEIGLREIVAGLHATVPAGFEPAWSAVQPTIVPPSILLHAAADHWNDRWLLPASTPPPIRAAIHGSAEYGVPLFLRTDLRTDLTIHEIGPNAFEARVQSTVSGGPFFVYRNGKFIGETFNGRVRFVDDAGGQQQIEAFPVRNAPRTRYFNDRVRFSWLRVAGAVAYRVEQFVAAAWTTRRKIRDDGSRYFRFQSAPLADDTEYTFRIMSIDAAGNETASASISGRIVRRPNPIMPNLGMTFDPATDDVDIVAV